MAGVPNHVPLFFLFSRFFSVRHHHHPTGTNRKIIAISCNIDFSLKHLLIFQLLLSNSGKRRKGWGSLKVCGCDGVKVLHTAIFYGNFAARQRHMKWKHCGGELMALWSIILITELACIQTTHNSLLVVLPDDLISRGENLVHMTRPRKLQKNLPIEPRPWSHFPGKNWLSYSDWEISENSLESECQGEK